MLVLLSIGRTHGSPDRGYGYIPQRFGGNVVRRMGTQQEKFYYPLMPRSFLTGCVCVCVCGGGGRHRAVATLNLEVGGGNANIPFDTPYTPPRPAPPSESKVLPCSMYFHDFKHKLK